ncbi:MAG: hypothetical protein EZS28_026122, partial [Streblomastix strix]
MELQCANFICARSHKTRRGTTTLDIVQQCEQPDRRIHPKSVILNFVALQANNTINIARTRRQYLRDIDQPSKHVCCTAVLRGKVNVYPNPDERRHARRTIVRHGLQRSYVTRNKAVSRIRTNAGPKKSGLGKSASRPILRNWTRSRSANPTTSNPYTKAEYLTVLRGLVTTQTSIIIAFL